MIVNWCPENMNKFSNLDVAMSVLAAGMYWLTEIIHGKLNEFPVYKMFEIPFVTNKIN